MHKLLLSFLLLCLSAGTVDAQRNWHLLWRKQPPKLSLQGKSNLENMNISRQLTLRMQQTFRQAQQAQTQLPQGYQIIMGEPIQQIFKTGELNASELYPDLPFLKNSTQTGKYLVARNNRLFVQEMNRLKQVWSQIDENLPRLYQEASNTPQPKNLIPWVAQTIPAQTNQLYIGEVHGYPEILEFVAKLLQELKIRHPNRKIFLFTEFLPENLTWNSNANVRIRAPKISHIYFPVWEQALQAQIPIIGLEIPAAVDSCCEMRYLNRKGSLRKQTIWASLEGVRLRNERWKKILDAYRAQYPDALFIIYTGADHSIYNRPFTLAQPNKDSFVLILYPEHYQKFIPTGRVGGTLVTNPMKGPLERLVDELDFQRQVVKWESPDLIPIAGFNIRIKVPVVLDE